MDTPKQLNEVGKDYWKLYTKIFNRKGISIEDHKSSLESLCFLEEQRVNVQETISEEGLFNEFTTESGDEIKQSNGFDKTLQRVISQVRYLKSDLNLNPEDVKQAKDDSSKLKLHKKNY